MKQKPVCSFVLCGKIIHEIRSAHHHNKLWFCCEEHKYRHIRENVNHPSVRLSTFRSGDWYYYGN